MSASPYTEDQRCRAIALAVELGPAEAQRRLLAEGISVKAATIRVWCNRAGVVTVTRERTAAATEQARASAEVRRARLADRMLDLAEMGADQAQALLEDASLRDVVGLFTRAIHDHQLLSGNATARTEQMTPEDAHAVVDKLAERRTA